jgi:hypothetical protein
MQWAVWRKLWKTKSPAGVCWAHTRSSAEAFEPSPAESNFLFETDSEPAPERLTSYGGTAVLILTLRSLGVAQSVAQHVQIKKRDRGYDEATFVESFVVSEERVVRDRLDSAPSETPRMHGNSARGNRDTRACTSAGSWTVA